MDKRKIVDVDIDFERRIAQSRHLALFRRNPTTWELLLMLARNENGSADGVYRTLETLETGYLGNSALLKFIRERRDDGLISFLENEKRSKWTVQLFEPLQEEIMALLDHRNNDILLAAGIPAATDVHAQSNGNR